MLHYTGHPFFDVGIAAITVHAHKRSPQEVTIDDLEQVARFIENEYVQPPLKGHLTMAFTSNAWFIQDAFNPDRPELTAEQRETRTATRKEWAARHVHEWASGASAPDEVCVFTGNPAISVALSGKLRESRAGRSQVPLLQGDEAINFFTNGVPGLPVSGLAVLALQFFPMGCAKSGVGLLAVHSDNERLMLRLARAFLEQNISAIAKARAAGEDKLPGSPNAGWSGWDARSEIART